MISILAALSVNANEVVYASKHGTFEDLNAILITEVAAGETIQILSVTLDREAQSNGFPEVSIQTKHGSGPMMPWQTWRMAEGNTLRVNNSSRPVVDDVIVGPCQLFIKKIQSVAAWQVSYKITKPSASGTTTSAPILLPPTEDAAQSWLVNLQVSSDLKTWEDVQPGQFLGSDSARFFRVKTSEAE